MFKIQRNHNSIRNPRLPKSYKGYLFFFGWAIIAIDNEYVFAEIICTRTNTLIYLYMIVEIMFYFNFNVAKFCLELSLNFTQIRF